MTGQHYVATRVHKLAHATEAPQRLAIDYGAKVFGNEAYAKGELCSAMVGAHLGFAPRNVSTTLRQLVLEFRLVLAPFSWAG